MEATAIGYSGKAKEGEEVMELEWDSTDEVRLDCTMVFGVGYDFFGLENLRQEAKGIKGTYLIWPAMGSWSLYRDSDGAYENDIASKDAAKLMAVRWDKE